MSGFIPDGGGGGGGGGDVNGPASSINNAVVLFNGTSGKNLKNSLVTIDGSGNIATPGSISGSLSLAGDVTGTSSANTVAKINGHTVKTQVLGASQDGYVLTWINGASDWEAQPPTGGGGGGFTAGGDLSGSSSSQQVISITGAAGVINIASTGNIITWNTATTAPGISQADKTTNSGTGAAMTIQAQNETGTTSTGGALNLISGTGTSASGAVVVKTGASTRLTVNATGVITIANLSTGIVHADSSGNLTSSTIVNADVNASAAIDVSKLAASATDGYLLKTVSGVPTWSNVFGATGDMATALGTATAGSSGKVMDAAAILPAKTSTDFDFQNHDSKNVRVPYLNGVIDDGNSGTSKTIDWTTGIAHKITLTGNCTFTFTNPPGPCWLQLRITQDGVGSRLVTWPTIKWTGGIAPTLTTTATTGMDIVSLWYDGSIYYGVATLGYA